MKPIEFEQSNVVYAKDQPEYLPLPAYRQDDGLVITCWKLNFFERLKILFYGKFYIQLLTFGNKLQPIKPTVENPFNLDYD